MEIGSIDRPNTLRATSQAVLLPCRPSAFFRCWERRPTSSARRSASAVCGRRSAWTGHGVSPAVAVLGWNLQSINRPMEYKLVTAANNRSHDHIMTDLSKALRSIELREQRITNNESSKPRSTSSHDTHSPHPITNITRLFPPAQRTMLHAPLFQSAVQAGPRHRLIQEFGNPYSQPAAYLPIGTARSHLGDGRSGCNCRKAGYLSTRRN